MKGSGFSKSGKTHNKNIDIKVSIFNEAILNIFTNFVPNKIITCNDKDPIWMNEKIKSKVKSKNQLYKVCIKNGRNEVDFLNLLLNLTSLPQPQKHATMKTLEKS